MAADWLRVVGGHRIAAYLILAGAMALAVTGYAHRSDSRLHRDAKRDCQRANRVAANQRLVLRTLLEDRKDAPGYLLYGHPAARRRSIAELTAALHAVPVYVCK